MASAVAAHDSALELAEQALACVNDDPGRAHDLARRALGSARGDVDAASTAERALALVAIEGGGTREAIAHARRAVAVAARHGAARREALGRMTLALALAQSGRMAAALKEMDRAAPALSGVEAGFLLEQRAIVLERMGRLDEALECHRLALPILRRGGERLWEARLLQNRGVLQVYRGAFAEAERDLRAGEALAGELGHRLLRALARQNLAFLAARRGDLTEALRDLDAAEQACAPIGGYRHAAAIRDRAELLLSVPLVGEAVEAAQHAVTLLAGDPSSSELADSRIVLAQALLLAGRLEEARDEALLARRAFRAQRRPAWAALAGYLAARGVPGPAAALAARAAAAELEAAGLRDEAVSARIAAAEAALAAGDTAGARRDLEPLIVLRGGTAARRARVRHAQALLALSSGDRPAARAALRSGLDLLDAHRAALGATELRAHAAMHGDALAALGVRLALDDGRPAEVLAWAERRRAGTLRHHAVHAPSDPEIARALSALRTAAAERDEALMQGRSTAALERRQARLEQEVRGLARHGGGQARRRGARRRAGGAPTLAAVRAALGGRALVEFVAHGDAVWGLVVTGDRAVVRPLGTLAPVQAEAEALRFALRRLGSAAGSPRALEAFSDGAAHAAGVLDAALLEPLLDVVGDRPLVIVPPGDLHALPWRALPSLAARPLVVAPSAAIWLRACAAGDGRTGEGTLLAAGPHLPHAAAEVAALGSAFPGARVLTAGEATAEAVVAGLERCDVAHLACHGSFRADHPLFSALRLADGPLTIYDLERLQRPPRLIVLSACDGALSPTTPGAELMGLAASLLGMGTATVVASLIPVPDEPTRRLMVAFHSALGEGLSPSDALVRAGAALDPGSRADRVAAAGFVCLGAG